MKVGAIIEQLDNLAGQEIDVEGTIIIIERAKRKIAFVASSEELNENESNQIFIDHPLAEIKTIIRPLPSMQLMFRGVMIYPPYFYRFKAQFRAIIDVDTDNVPILKNISQIDLTIPYAGKTADNTIHDSYQYSAQIDYRPTPIEGEKEIARAVVTSQKNLLLVKEDVEAELIPQDENRYARRIANRAVRLSGWIESVPSKNDIISHMLFFTTAIRASVVAIGPLREECTIWIRPTALYKLLKAHIPLKPGQALSQKVDIIGEVDYLQDEDVPMVGVKSPGLVFSHLYRIIIHEQAYLR